MTAAMISSNDGEFFDSLERDDLDQIEATFVWGDDVLQVRHLPADAAVSVGERAGCTFFIPASELPPPHTGSDCVEVLAAGDSALRRDAPLHMTLGPFQLRLRIVSAGRQVPLPLWETLKESALGSVGMSLTVHAMLLGSLAMFLPSLGADDDDSILRDRIFTMQKYLVGAAERERDALMENTGAEGGAAESSASGKQALEEAGMMGKVNAPQTKGYWTARGDAKPHEATLSRETTLSLVRDFGILGLISSSPLADPNAPVVPWGENLRGADAESHLGAMWGVDPGDNGGIGGLGLTGVGEGGCPAGAIDCGRGIGLTDIGLLGHQLADHLGQCVGPNCGRGPGRNGSGGIGNGSSPILGTHVPKAPIVKTCGEQACGFETMGRIPPEVIQRIVRQNAGRYRLCYEHGLRSNPSLNGHVRVKFVIDRSGAVSTAQDGGSDLPDEQVRSCVVQSFYALAFPSPEGGLVRVTYPIIFTPAEN